MITRSFISLPSAFAVMGFLGLSVAAQDETNSSESPQSGPRGYQLQRLDEPALPAEPVELRTEADQKRIEAQSWYMTGWLFKQRERYREALSAFEKAAEIRPDFAQAYMALIEVSLHLRDSAKVVEYAKKAVEHDPENFQLLRQLGVEMVKNRQLKPAIQYLEQALKSTELDHQSRFFVLINRDLGIIYNGIGETDKAGACYEVVLDALLQPARYGLDSRTRSELQKHASTSFERIGQVLLAADRTDSALKALEQAVSERKGKPGQVNLLLAQVYYRTEDYARGLEQLDQYFESGQSQGRTPFVLLGSLLEKLDQSDTLIERLETLAGKETRNQDLRFFLAATYAAAQRLDDAEKIYRAALDRKPSAEAYLGLAGIYRQRGKARELLENLSSTLDRQQELQAVAVRFEAEMKAIEEDRELLQALLEAGRDGTQDGVGPNDFSRVFFLARLAARAELIDEAVEFFRLALKAAPSRAESVLSGLGQTLLDADRFAEAAEVYQEAIANPLAARSKPDNFLRKALALEMAGQTENALKAVEEASKLIPGGHPFLAFRKAWIYYHSQQFDQAVKFYEEFLKKYPDETLARQVKFSLSAIYVQLGEVTRGEQILERFLEENPDDPGVNNDLGYLYADQGKNLKKARDMIAKAVKAEPENAAYADSMGWVLYKLGELEDARKYLVKASTMENGDDPTIWDHLGDCYRKLDDREQAEQAWNKALKLLEQESRPDEDLVRQIREKLGLKVDSEKKTTADQSESD